MVVYYFKTEKVFPEKLALFLYRAALQKESTHTFKTKVLHLVSIAHVQLINVYIYNRWPSDNLTSVHVVQWANS